MTFPQPSVTDPAAAGARLLALATELARHPDPLSGRRLDDLLVALGWEPGRFLRAAGMIALTRDGTIEVYLGNFGDPRELDPDDHPDADALDTATDQPYLDSDALVDAVAEHLDLAPADPFAPDPLGVWGPVPHRLRAGHWAVSLATVQHDSGLDILSMVDFTWGADLTGRLTALIPPPASVTPADASAVAQPLPSDYRWLLDTYGFATLGDLTLVPPDQLRKPDAAGPALRHRLPDSVMATTADGGELCWLMEPDPSREDPDNPDHWSLELRRPGHTERIHSTLLHFLVTRILETRKPATAGEAVTGFDG
ncbi:hypothetical protein GCM10010168_08740 [Actinoplanes ianthinogenes]|uniref:Knr4/Smi1-like domain-containing protein n=1 Tax=Actinoplanes ianthinogenes TaxID=122358 RepID=A0ABM7LXK9_9ACTN|nr:hypothetical protein [Actinoplanes ianthinogenes]BCJ44061.1 hypothetical protein Aiant_47180 [Actinoplanes ianthinogenes]GGQ95524.1 hypothetical protein GCM10010168_08740 [Actinoplanes ianthinogenes]